MDYRGGDLDLRTPGQQSRSDGGFGDRDFSGSTGTSLGAAPIYVDDTLMSCCNHAYDVAVAHRSSDVRLEHLLYALTRIDAAAEVLEAAGIRDAGLRRDGATIIASEIPIGLTNGTSQPRRSAAFEEALRLAAQQGYRRNRPATVSDLLHVFLEVKPDLPGLELLRRHMPHSYREADDYASYAMPPPAPPRFVESRPRAPIIEEPRPARYEPQETVDAYQNARLGELEHMVRSLREELSSERNTFGVMLTDMKRDLSTQRPVSSGVDPSPMLREMMERTNERLATIERGVAMRIEDLNRQLGGVADKLEGMARRDLSGGVDMEPINRQFSMLMQKVEAIEAQDRPEGPELNNMTRQLQLVMSKLTALEQSTGDGELDIDIMPILARLEGVESAVRERNGAQDETFVAVSERLKGLERLMGTQPDVQVDLSSLESRLSDIETAVMSQDSSVQSNRLDERLDSLEQLVSQQFTKIGQSLSLDRMPDVDLTTALQSEIKALSGALATSQATQERMASSLQTEIKGISAFAAAGGAPNLDGVFDGLQDRLRDVAVMGERLSEMSREQQQANAALASRLENLEQRIMRTDEGMASGRADFVRELGDVHEAIMKLNSNQHAISQSIDGWRGETTNQVHEVSSRLVSMQQNLGGPSEDLSRLSQNLDKMYRVTVERYHRRNRFWFWLFGTDDWIGASWPSQTARVEQELQALKRSTA